MWCLDDHRLQTRLGQTLAAKARLDQALSRVVGQVDDRDLARSPVRRRPEPT